jgi:transcriptional regulator with XRE-family HTH domain
MNEQHISTRSARITPPGYLVKARVYAAGIRLIDLAQEAHVSKSSLSGYLAGRQSVPEIQYDIYLAFCRLTGTDFKALSISEFWGSLYRRRAS